MHSRETVAEVLDLASDGLNNCEIARRTGVARPTVREWRTGRLPHSFESKPMLYRRPTDPGPRCTRCSSGKHRFDASRPPTPIFSGSTWATGAFPEARETFTGCASPWTRNTRRSSTSALPRCRRSCLGTGFIASQPRRTMSRFHAYSKGWPCLFPQHGPGKKHEREIVLREWQQELVDLVPTLLLRG
jgi:hypothetical protein